MLSLADLAVRLERELRDPGQYGAVVTRVQLRTGVNLREPKPDQSNDPQTVACVAEVLGEMGYRFGP